MSKKIKSNSPKLSKSAISRQSSKALGNRKSHDDQLGAISEIFEPDDFAQFFPYTCQKNNALNVLYVLTIPITEYKSELDILNLTESFELLKQSSKSHTTQESIVTYNVFALTTVVEKKDVIVKIIFKDMVVNDPILTALSTSLEFQPAVVHLKFINCNLGANEIMIIRDLIEKYKHITELYIDKNPYKSSNIGILVDESSPLKHLTIRLCQISDNCVKSITQSIGCVKTPLQVLNLSSNYITDLGAKYITEALRINRSLIALNLSNNFLTNESCFLLSTALQKFELDRHEIKIRRQETYDRLYMRRELSKKYDYNPTTQGGENRSQKARSPRRRPNSSKSYSRSDEAREKYLNAHLPKLIHPFIIDVEAKDGALYCHGNFQLAHLNLAFNKITEIGCKTLHSILNYQVNQMSNVGYLGIVNLVIDGNQISSEMYETIQEINDFLTIKNTTKSK